MAVENFWLRPRIVTIHLSVVHLPYAIILAWSLIFPSILAQVIP